MSHPLDDAAPAIARWLAPYLANELGLEGTERAESRSPLDTYDARACELFVRELGWGVLTRAADFFMKLEEDGQVGSRELANHLSIGSPRNISSALTNSLKRRASTLGLARPWEEAQGPDGRTIWLNRDGIAALMVTAIQGEMNRRSGLLYKPGDECPRSGIYVAVTAATGHVGREITVVAGERFPPVQAGAYGYQLIRSGSPERSATPEQARDFTDSDDS